jgi:hypothetical protein
MNPGAGDVTDRLTILALKILHYAAAGKSVDHLVSERNALLGKLRGRELNGSWFEQVLELGAVNSALWHLTDELRRMDDKIRSYTMTDPSRSSELEYAGEMGLEILHLNDRRAALVEAINVLSGEHLGSEKGGV